MLLKEISQLLKLKELNKLAITSKIKIKILKKKFFSVLPNPDIFDIINFKYSLKLILNLRISKEEIKKAIRRLKVYKALKLN